MFFGDLGMPLVQQQLAFAPIQLGREPAFTRDCYHLQSLVQFADGLCDLSCDLARAGQKGEPQGRPHLCPSGAVGDRAAAQKRYSLLHIPSIDLGPPPINHSERTPVREAVLCCHCNQFFCSLIQRSNAADQRK